MASLLRHLRHRTVTADQFVELVPQNYDVNLQLGL